MEIFRNLGWLFVKMFVWVFIASFVFGMFNYFIYVFSVNSLANDVVMRSSSYNFLYTSDKAAYMDELMSPDTYLGKFNGSNKGSYSKPLTGASAITDVKVTWDTGCAGKRSVVIDDNLNIDNPTPLGCTTFDPRLGIDVDKYEIPNRKEHLRVEVNTTYRLELFAFGTVFSVNLPVKVSKPATATQYYKW